MNGKVKYLLAELLCAILLFFYPNHDRCTAEFRSLFARITHELYTNLSALILRRSLCFYLFLLFSCDLHAFLRANYTRISHELTAIFTH